MIWQFGCREESPEGLFFIQRRNEKGQQGKHRACLKCANETEDCAEHCTDPAVRVKKIVKSTI